MSARYIKTLFFGIAVAVFVLHAFVLPGRAIAAPGINKQLPYQGILKTSGGAIVSDGNYDMVFRIYDAATGGTTLWTGTYTAANSNPVAVSSGVFRVLLGSGTGNAMTLDFNDDSYYLGVTVGTDSEMTPRQRIGATGYAFNADTVDGVHIVTTTANPEAAVTGSVGDLALDTANGTLYIKTSGTNTNTGWTVAGGGGSSTFAGLTDTVVASPAAGHLLIYDGTDSWDNKAVSGDITINTAGIAAIAADAVALTTDTTGNYVSSVATGAGLTGGGVGSEGAALTLALDIAGLTAESAAASADEVAIYDASAGAIRKMTRANFLSGVTGALTYQGTWNASTNTPTLSNATGSQGQYHVVDTAGSQNLGSGIIAFTVGDWVVHNGTVWEKLDNTNDVQSVFGRIGVVVATTGDYTASQVTNVAAGNIAATNVQAALNELDTEKQPLDAQLTDVAGLVPSDGLFIVGNGTNFVTESGNTARTSLGLGTADSPTFAGLAVNSAGGISASFTRSASGQFFNFTDGIDIFGLYNRAGSPEGAIAANVGSLAIDTTSGSLYIKTTDTTNTGWTAFGAAAGNSLQLAYGQGGAITTTDAKDIDIVLADTATDSNFDIDIATGGTNTVSISRLDGAGTADPAQFLLLENLDLDRAQPAGLLLASAAGGLTTAIDATDVDITNALSFGANTILGTTGNIDLTNFDVVGATGNITTAGDLAVNGGDITTTATALNITVGNTGVVSFTDGTNVLVTLTDDGTTGTLAITGDLAVNSGTVNSLALARTATGQFVSFADGTDTFGLYNNAGTPEGVIAANVGSLALDTTNGKLYIKTTDTANTGWAQTGGSLQLTYDAGGSITTADAKDIDITLANTATDSNLDIDIATGGTNTVSISRLDGAGVADPTQLLLIENLDVDRVQPTGLLLSAAAGGLTTAIDVSDADITTALNFGANNLVGTTGNIDLTNFDVAGATGNITTAGDLALNGGDLTSTATTFNLDIGNTGTLNVRDGTNTLLSIVDGGTVGNVAASGTFTASGGSITSGANGADGSLVIYSEQGVTDYTLSFAPNAAMTQNVALNFPVDDGTASQFLQTNGSGALAWANALTSSLTDNLADALDIQEGTNNYININTTNASENITFGNATTNPSYSFLGTGNVGIGTSTPSALLDTVFTSTSTTAASELGLEFNVTDTGVVTTGTDTLTGLDFNITRTGATGGTINTIGLDLDVVGDLAGAGTSTVTGLDVNVSGADTNIAAIFQGGNVGIGQATPASALHITSATAAALQIDPFGAVAGNTGEQRFLELAANGTNYVGFKAPDSIATSTVWALPNADGTSNQILTTNGAGALSWSTAAAGLTYSQKSASFTAAAGNGYLVNTSAAAITVTLPDITTDGEKIQIVDVDGNAAANNITVNADASDTIEGAASFTIDLSNAVHTFVADAIGNRWTIQGDNEETSTVLHHTNIHRRGADAQTAAFTITPGDTVDWDTLGAVMQFTSSDANDTVGVTVGTNQVTINQAGFYRIEGHITFDGAFRHYQAQITDGTTVLAAGNQVSTSASTQPAQTSIVYEGQFAAGTVIDLRGQVNETTADINAFSFVVRQLPSAVITAQAQATEYIYNLRTSAYTLTSTADTNPGEKMPSSVSKSSGSNITFDGTDTWTLQAGKTYRMSAGLRFDLTAAANQFAPFGWYNETAVSFISDGGSAPADGVMRDEGSHLGNLDNTELIFAPTANTNVSLRARKNSGTGVALQRMYTLIETIADGTMVAQFTGATSGTAGTTGFVLAPDAGDQGALLLGNATWSDPNTLFVDTINSRLGLGTNTPATVIEALIDSAVTNAIQDVLTLSSTSTGTVTAGLGSGLVFNVEDLGGVEEQASIDVLLTDVTDASEDADMTFNLNRAGIITEAMRILSTGNVGIGTTTPSALLDTVFTSTSTTAASELGLEFNVTDTGVVTIGIDTLTGLDFNVTRTGATGGTINTVGLDLDVVGDLAGPGTSKAIGLDVNVSGAETNYAAIFQGGNVGIGTTAPASELHIVEGTASGIDRGNVFRVQGSTLAAGEVVMVIGTTDVPTTNEHFLLMQSDTDGTRDTEFRFETNGNAFADGAWTGSGADYAEWFEREGTIATSSLIGLNTATGKVREWEPGDPLIGIHSINPAFVGNAFLGAESTNEVLSQTHVMVGIAGQLDLVSTDITETDGRVSTSDGQFIGWRMASGKVSINREDTTQGQLASSNIGNVLQGNPDGNIDIEGELAVVDTTFEGSIIVRGHATFNEDTIGQAKILAGDTEARITFSEEYAYLPIVTVTPVGLHDMNYGVDDVTTKGFAIRIEPSQAEDIVFNWHAFGSIETTKIFVSDGTIEEVNIVVEDSPLDLPGDSDGVDIIVVDPAPEPDVVVDPVSVTDPDLIVEPAVPNEEPAPTSEDATGESPPDGTSGQEPVADPVPIADPVVDPAEPVVEPVAPAESPEGIQASPPVCETCGGGDLASVEELVADPVVDVEPVVDPDPVASSDS